MPPQLEENHVVPTAWQDEALARDGVSREVPCSALKGETVPDSLPATPKSPPCKISRMKRVASPDLMHDTGCLGLVHWDDPEGWYGEGGGRRVQDRAGKGLLLPSGGNHVVFLELRRHSRVTTGISEETSPKRVSGT